MRARTSPGLVVVLALAGCSIRPCDEAKLGRLADMLEDRSPSGRDAALDALADACPRMPKGLASSLEGWFGSKGWLELLEQTGRSRFDDPVYVELRSRTCPLSGSAWDAAIHAHDRDAAMFEACGLQRYNLIAEGETFAFEDLDAFVLYQWLTEKGIDEPLARRVARALLSTHWSPDALMDACRDQQQRCALALERASMSLPRASRLLPSVAFGERTQLWVGRDAVLVGDERVPTPDTAASVSLPLRAALAGKDPRVLILADASLTFGMVAEHWLDAVVAGGTEFELAVFAAEGLQAIALTPAQSWFAPAARERETEWRPPPPELWLSSAALELRDEGRTSASLTRACPGARCLDLDALEQAFGEPLRASSDRTLALRIDRDVPYETVVALLSWVRGRTSGATIVDTNPPLYWHTGSTLVLGDAKVERKPGRDRSMPPTDELLAAYAAKRAPLRACLLADPAFMAGEAEFLALVWASQHEGALMSIGVGDDALASPELRACIGSELDIELAAPHSTLTRFILDFGGQLLVPIRFELDRTK